MSEPDSMEPYGDDYNFGNCYSRIEWRPGHPLFQKELNAFQAGRLMDQRILADRLIPNGSILSGMTVDTLGNMDSQVASNETNKNLFKFTGNATNDHTNLSTINGDITDNVETYNRSGEIDYQSTATDDDQKTGLDIWYAKPKDQNVTLSFDIEEIGGTSNGILNNISILPTGGSTIVNATVDGYPVADDLSNNSGDNLHVLENSVKQPYNISEGNYHQVIVTFNNKNVGDNNVEFSLLFNNGFSALMGTTVRINHMKIEAGTKVTSWISADNAGIRDTRKFGINVSSGSLYLDGQPRVFKNQSINITGVGAEQVGAKLITNIVTPNEDHRLNDDTPGAADEGAAGADREHYTVELTYGSRGADAIIFYFQDGKLVANSDSDQYDQLNSVLALRTYEQSGSFLSWGMGITPYPDPYNSDMIDLQFAEGAAYVKGHRIYTDGTQSLRIPIESGTADTENEVAQYTLSGNGVTSNLIIPSVQPVDLPSGATNNVTTKNIDPQYLGLSVFGKAKAKFYDLDVEPDINLGGQEGFGAVQSGFSVDPEYDYQVYRDDPDTTEVQNNFSPSHNTYHFVTENGTAHLIVDDTDNFCKNGIHTGSSIFLVCVINRPFVDEDTAHMPESVVNEDDLSGGGYLVDTPTGASDYDYHLVYIKGNGEFAKHYNPNDPNMKVAIDFNDDTYQNVTEGGQATTDHASGVTPLPDTQVSINYQAFYSRDDLITLNANGTFHDVQGQPGLSNEIQPPVNNSTNANQALSIGTVHIYPNCQQASTHMSTIPAISFSGMNDMALQINSLQENMAILAARQATMAGINPSTLADTFSDFFINHDKADVSDEEFNIDYSPFQYIQPGFIGEGSLPLVDNDASPNAKTITTSHNTATDPYLVRQDTSTDTLQLNRTRLMIHRANIVCDPSSFHDHYANNVQWNPTRMKTLTAKQAQNAAAELIHQRTTGFHTTGGNNELNDMNLNKAQLQEIAKGEGTTYKNFISKTTTLNYVNKSYMPPQWVHIQGNGFTPNADNLSVKVLSVNNLPLNVETDPSQLAKDESYQSISNAYAEDNPFGYQAGVPGTESGTARANNDGVVSCWFLIPRNVIPCGTQTIALYNQAGDFAVAKLDGTADQPTYHSNLNDLYINSGTLVNHVIDWTKNNIHRIDNDIVKANDHLHAIDQFDIHTTNDIHQVTQNLDSDIASENSNVSSVSTSLSAAEASESNYVQALSADQNTINNLVQGNIDNIYSQNSSEENQIQDNAANLSAVSGSAASGILSNAYDIASNADSVSTAFDSANSRFDTDEVSVMSNALQIGINTTAIGQLTADHQSEEDAIALNAYNASTAAANLNTSINTAVASQTNWNATQSMTNNQMSSGINTDSQAANYAQVGEYGNDIHDLCDHEVQEAACNVSPWIESQIWSWGALNGLAGANAAGVDSNANWSVASNHAWERMEQQGGLWIAVGKAAGEGGSNGYDYVQIVPPNTDAHQYDGQSMSYKHVKDNIINNINSQITY